MNKLSTVAATVSAHPSLAAPQCKQCTQTGAAKAARHLLIRIHQDPRLAYLIGPGSEYFELLTEEFATAKGLDAEVLRREISANTKYEAWTSKAAIQQLIDEAVAKALAGATC